MSEGDLLAVWLTLILAASTTAILLLLSPPLAWWLSRSQHRLRPLVEAMVALPLVLPPTVLGFYLLLTFSPEYGLGGWWRETFGAPLAFSFLGLLIAVFFSYRKPRQYDLEKILAAEPETVELNLNHIWVALLAIAVALGLQLMTTSIVLGALAGFIIFTCGGVIKFRESQDAFTQGVRMMSLIGFIMISAAGFAAVMKETHGVESLVQSVSTMMAGHKGLAAFLMLLVGLLITMWIGYSFSTVPIIATIYVPLCIHLGFSPMATIALVGTAGALGDAGSPASDSTLGPTSGLNADGQHDHIWDSVVPTFIHYNIPLVIFGWIAAMVL